MIAAAYPVTTKSADIMDHSADQLLIHHVCQSTNRYDNHQNPENP